MKSAMRCNIYWAEPEHISTKARGYRAFAACVNRRRESFSNSGCSPLEAGGVIPKTKLNDTGCSSLHAATSVHAHLLSHLAPPANRIIRDIARFFLLHESSCCKKLHAQNSRTAGFRANWEVMIRGTIYRSPAVVGDLPWSATNLPWWATKDGTSPPVRCSLSPPKREAFPGMPSKLSQDL